MLFYMYQLIQLLTLLKICIVNNEVSILIKK